jgi:hypothetical protein
MTPHRRAFLRTATMGSAIGCACCMSPLRAVAADTAHVAATPGRAPRWSYAGVGGLDPYR